MEDETSPFERLTVAERRVLRACHGRSNDEVATLLGIQVGTVKAHVLSARQKLDGVARITAARMFQEYESRHFVPRQIGQMADAECRRKDERASSGLATVDQVAEPPFPFDDGSGPDRDGSRRYSNDYRKLIRVTLTVVAILMTIVILILADRVVPFFERIGAAQLRYNWL